jgi:hypothetical protein
VVIAANIVSSWIGSQKDFIAGANFTIWCNISLTAAAAVACAPQIRSLFLKRLKQLKPQERELAQNSMLTEETRRPTTEHGTEKRSKSTPIVISDKFLSGAGKVEVLGSDATLKEHRGSGEHEHEIV